MATAPERRDDPMTWCLTGGSGMTVLGVYGFRIKQGRFDDWLAMSREGEKLVRRLGGGDVRIWAPAAAGSDTPVHYGTVEFADGASWGAFMDANGSDMESLTYMDRTFGHVDSPAEMLATGLVHELAFDNAPTGRGPVSENWMSRIKPGRFDDFMALSHETIPVAADLGAVGVRVYHVGAMGPETGAVSFVAEYESFAALGRAGDGMATAEVQATMARIMAAESPIEIVSRSVYAEVPLA